MSAQQLDRSRDYLAFMRCEEVDYQSRLVREQLSAWLREKNLDIGLDDDSDWASGAAKASVRVLHDGAGDDLMLTLVEDAGRNGVWTTNLISHAKQGAAGWVSLDVTNSDGNFVDVPRLARYLMQVLPLGDGTVKFEDRHQRFTATDIDRLTALLADEQRHGLVFVAGTDATGSIPVDAFAAKVDQWAKQVYGLAQVIVLDPAGTEAFQAAVGEEFAARTWAIRTYRPGVRFDEPTDARRHRTLSTQRLAEYSDGRVRHLLGEIAREQSATRLIEPELQRLRRRFERYENRRLAELLGAEVPAEQVTVVEVVESPPVELSTVAEDVEESPVEIVEASIPQIAEADLVESQLELVREVLGIREVTRAALTKLMAAVEIPRREVVVAESMRRRIDALQAKADELENANDAILRELDDAQLEAESHLIDLDKANDKLAYLQARLKARGDFEASYAEVPAEFKTDMPNSFEELLARIADISGVEFTGDVDKMLRLDQIDTNGSAVRTAWDAVLTLADYVNARAAEDWDQGLRQYVEQPPSGYRSISKGKFAAGETAATMQQHGGERIFPAPPEVDPSGQVTMEAHFKLAKIGMVSPRMYVFDAHPKVPKVFIGYIGAHLTNTQTN